MTSYHPICTLCSRLGKRPGMACDAYPDGIPEEIQEGRSMHLAPMKGDHGLQFELDEDKREAATMQVSAGLIPAEALTRSAPEQDKAQGLV